MRFNNSVDKAVWTSTCGKGGKTTNAMTTDKLVQPMEHEPYIYERAQAVMDDVMLSRRIRNA